MRIITPISAVALMSLALVQSGCGRERRGAPVQAAARGKASSAKPRAKLGGRTFRINAASGVADPMAIKAALESGGPMPAGVEEVDKSGRPVNPKARAPAQGKLAAGPGGGMRLPTGMPSGGQGAAPRLNPAVAQRAKRQLTEFYEVITGKPVRVLSAAPESGMWRFALEVDSNGKKVQQVVYVTGDGRKFFEGGGVHLKSELALVKAHKRFATCLAEKKVRVFGDPRGKTTMQQLKVIGKFGGMVFIDCARNPKNCAKLGVKKLPTVAVGNDLTPGVQNRAFLESATGCK